MNKFFLTFVAAILLQASSGLNPIFADFAIHYGDVSSPICMTFKSLPDECLSPRVLVTEQLAICAVILTPLALYFERHRRPQTSIKVLGLIALATVFMLTDQGLFYSGLSLTDAPFAVALWHTVPAVTFVVHYIARHEHVAFHTLRGKAKVVGTAISFAGAILVVLGIGKLRDSPWTIAWRHKYLHEDNRIGGGAMIVFSCVSWAVYKLSKAKILDIYPVRLTVLAIMTTIASVEAAIITMIWERKLSVWKLHYDVRLLATVYGGVYLACEHCISSWLTEVKGPIFLQLFYPFKLIATYTIGWIWFDEGVVIGRLVGNVVIMCGIFMVLWGGLRVDEEVPPFMTEEVETTTE